MKFKKIFFIFFSLCILVQIVSATTSPLPIWYYEGGGEVSSIAISNDGKIIASGSTNSKVYCFSNDGNLLWEYQTGDSIKKVVISDDGSYIAAGSIDKKVYLFSRDGKLLWSYKLGGKAQGLGISSDGQYIAAGGTEDLTVYSFSREGNLLGSYKTGGWTSNVVISKDGSYIATVPYNVYFLSNNGKVLWEKNLNNPKNSQAGLDCLGISADGSILVVGGNDLPISAYSNDGALLWSYIANNLRVDALAVSSNGQFITFTGAATGGNIPNVYCLSRDGSLLWSKSLSASGFSGDTIGISSDGSYIVVGSNDMSVYVFSNNGDLLSKTESTAAHLRGSVTDVAISGDGQIIAAGYNGGTIDYFKNDISGYIPNPTKKITPLTTTQKSSSIASTSSSGDSGTPILIIVIIIIFVCCCIGFGIYWIKRKSSINQPPEILVNGPDIEQSSLTVPEDMKQSVYVPEVKDYQKAQKQKEEEERHSQKITNLQKRVKEHLIEAQKIGTVPDSIVLQTTVLDIPTLESALKTLDDLVKTAKPQLTLTPEKTQFAVNEWHRLPIHITNIGNAGALDVTFTFTDEFETRWIKPVNIEAGITADVIIGLRPKQKGNIPLEIRVQYKDVRNKEYQQTFEYWINVSDSITAAGGQTPLPFTPKPITPRQPPTDLSYRYTDWEFIGKGGFARVFKAKRKDGIFVAVKIPLSIDAVTGKSFIAEMQNWTKLRHPNIVTVYDFNIMPMPYFEEELCDSALSDQAKPIESEEAAWILFNICEGLKFAHSQKIIHRDLKPQNILLKNGVPKISDWGLSRIISESASITVTSFTPYYAAPEQINNRSKDERTDIWQIGIILYELVTGILPFTGDSMIEIGMNIATKDPIPPGELKPGAKVIDAVVMKCLQKDPGNRYQSVLEIQKDLALYLRENYSELLKTSVSAHDYTRSAYYCGDLVMINILTGDMKSAYKYLLDLVHYSKGAIKVEAQDLSEQIKMRMEMGVTEIPDELIQKAEIIVHQVSVGFRNKR